MYHIDQCDIREHKCTSTDASKTTHSALSNKIINKTFLFFYLVFIWVKIISLILSRVNRKSKTGDPREKSPDHPQAELDLYHI